MKKILFGTALAMLGAQTALATDLPARAQTYAAPFSWSGFYGGVHAGYGWGGNNILDTVTAPDAVGTFKPSGAFGGVQIGYNSQFAPHWLIGGEIEFSGADLKDSRNFAFPVHGSNDIDFFGSARTRLGYVQDRNLYYLTGGVAWMHDTNDIYGLPAHFTHADQFHVGWTIGAGWEYAIDARWSWKLEYLYADFEKNAANMSGAAVLRTSQVDLSTVKVGLNYRFGDTSRPVSTMPVKAVAAPSAWDGGYLGLHGGYAGADVDLTEGGVSPAQFAKLKPEGGFGGFQSGSSWRFAPNWLFGLETDASFMDLKESGLTSPGSYPISTKLDALGTARARFGYVMDSALIYATCGAAYGHEESSYIVPGVETRTSKENHFGWTAGGGIEWMFAPQWSAKVEYLHIDLGKNEYDLPSVVGNPKQVSEITVDTVKLGINYHGPVLERLFGAN